MATYQIDLGDSPMLEAKLGGQMLTIDPYELVNIPQPEAKGGEILKVVREWVSSQFGVESENISQSQVLTLWTACGEITKMLDEDRKKKVAETVSSLTSILESQQDSGNGQTTPKTSGSTASSSARLSSTSSSEELPITPQKPSQTATAS